MLVLQQQREHKMDIFIGADEEGNLITRPATAAEIATITAAINA